MKCKPFIPRRRPKKTSGRPRGSAMRGGGTKFREGKPRTICIRGQASRRIRSLRWFSLFSSLAGYRERNRHLADRLAVARIDQTHVEPDGRFPFGQALKIDGSGNGCAVGKRSFRECIGQRLGSF